MKLRYISKFFAALCALAALAAACGNDDSPQGAAPAVPEAPTAAPEPTDQPDTAAEVGDADGSDGEQDQSETAPEEAAPPAPAGPPHEAELSWGNFVLADRIAAKLAAGEPLSFVISVAATGEGGFAGSYGHGWDQAAAEAADRHGIEVDARVIGPNSADAGAQADAIGALVAVGDIDCLAVEAANPGLLDDAIDAVVEAGVPVFTVGGDSPDSKRFAYYGLDDYQAGLAAGRTVGQWAVDGGILVRRAGVLTGDAGDQGSFDLMRGFEDGLGEIHSGAEFANGPADAESVGFDPVSAYNATEAWVLDNIDVDILFHTDAGLEQAAQVIADQLLYGDMYAVGFHISPAVADYIRERVVVAAMVSRHADQARQAGLACGDFLGSGVYQTGHVVTEPLAVTRDNVDDADWSLPENR